MIRSVQEARHAEPLEILLLGNVTRDVDSHDDPDGGAYTLGGSVSYAAFTCHRLQVAAEVVTRAAADVDLDALRAIACCTVLPSDTTTTFVNRYEDTGRVQYCYHPAAPIRAADLTPRIRRASVVFMCPIMQEVGPDVPACFGDAAFQAAGPQGFLRRIDGTGRVQACAWPHRDVYLRHLDIIILSREDIEYDLRRLDALLAQVPMVILSNYRHGCDIFHRRENGIHRQHVPPRPAREVDPTGAGDIFATAFLIRYLETASLWHAARFANITASFGVEGIGTSAIPTRDIVMQYMRDHPDPEPAS